MKKTNRGFPIYSEFKDTYKNTIRVQMSSSACAPRCWVFVKDKDGNDGVFDKATGQYISATAHLSKAQARRLARALLKFAEEAE